MKIQTKFFVVTFLSVAAAAVLGFLLYASSLKIHDSWIRMTDAEEIVKGTGDLRFLTLEYIIFPQQRTEDQRGRSIDALHKGIDSAQTDDPEQSKLLPKIEQNLQNAQMLFGKMKVRSDKQIFSEKKQSRLFSPLEERLVSQLSITMQEIISDAFAISDLNRVRIESLQRQADQLIIIVIGGVIFIMSVICFGVIFGITRPLNTLTTIERTIAKGDLDVEIGKGLLTPKNEIGLLAQSFHAMILKLRSVYASLEEKVKIRTLQLDRKVKELNIVLEQLPAGVAVVDSKSGKAVLINSWGRKLLGNKFIKEPIAKALEKGGTVTEDDIVVTHPDGENIQMRATSTAIKDQEGKVQFVVAVFEDITKEKQIDKAKTEFVSLASHQLRTPLATINWYSEMLLGGDAGEINDTQKDYLEEIYQSSQRLVKLANALLDVSRINLGTFVVEPEITDLIALIKSVIDEQKPQINEKKLEIITKFGSDMPHIQADPKLLRMIFQNLLSNAVKYTPIRGKITLCSALEHDKKNIQVSVADTGFGIPQKDQEKIFTKLFRATNARQHEPEGTGLGLYIVKSMVSHSGGKIWFESEENKGTTFYVMFPLRTAR